MPHLAIIAYIVFFAALFAVWWWAVEPKWLGWDYIDKRRTRRVLEKEKDTYRDITELAVKWGYADPRPEGWYGFNLDHCTVILRMNSELKFSDYTTISSYSEGGEAVLRGMLDTVSRAAQSHFKKRAIKQEIEILTDPERIVLGEPQEWVND